MSTTPPTESAGNLPSPADEQLQALARLFENAKRAHTPGHILERITTLRTRIEKFGLKLGDDLDVAVNSLERSAWRDLAQRKLIDARELADGNIRQIPQTLSEMRQALVWAGVLIEDIAVPGVHSSDLSVADNITQLERLMEETRPCTGDPYTMDLEIRELISIIDRFEKQFPEGRTIVRIPGSDIPHMLIVQKYGSGCREVKLRSTEKNEHSKPTPVMDIGFLPDGDHYEVMDFEHGSEGTHFRRRGRNNEVASGESYSSANVQDAFTLLRELLIIATGNRRPFTSEDFRNESIANLCNPIMEELKFIRPLGLRHMEYRGSDEDGDTVNIVVSKHAEDPRRFVFKTNVFDGLMTVDDSSILSQTADDGSQEAIRETVRLLLARVNIVRRKVRALDRR